MSAVGPGGDVTAEVQRRTLDRIHEYREAARLAVEADADEQTRQLALLDLVDHLRKTEPDALVVRWGEVAIWSECADFLGMGDSEPWTPPPSFDATIRRLRAQGLVACSRCHQRLPEEADLERWSRRRADASQRRDVRKGAVR
jgi:hypothetical protein